MGPSFNDAVPVSRIFLALDNPRHETYDSEAKVIAYLCEKENVFALARDIAKNGLNPLERFALIPLDKKKASKTDATYAAAEGNRRLCALKLLNDPDLAPANLRKPIEKLAEAWTPVKTVMAAIFPDQDSVKVWLDRIHNGAQGGIGRRDWNAEQKQRFDGGAKNKAAQDLLDYAEAAGMLTAAERRGKLTTAQRFLGNDVFRETLGIDQSNPDDLARSRPKPDFDIIVRQFIRDLVGNKAVNSRMNKQAIIAYARPLATLPNVTGVRIVSEALTATPSAKTTKPRRGKPQQPARAKHVQYEAEIFDALKALGNDKLRSLYHSICTVDLDPHTPLVAVGAWSFFETLTALAGRNDSVSFDSYLSKQTLISFGITGDTVTLRNAVGRMKEFGNSTKHHPFAATFNGDQLNNDFVALKGVILACINAASKG